MLALAALAAAIVGSLTAGWLLWLRARAGLLVTRSALLSPLELLTALQAWIAGAGLAVLATLEVYGPAADPNESALVARAGLAGLVGWLPIAVGLLVPTVRRLKQRGDEPFVDLSSAMAYSIALVAWFGTGRWQDAF